MANRMPLQPGDGSGNPGGAQPFYYSQNGTPPQQMYVNFPMNLAQIQAMNAQQMHYQNFLETPRRAQADPRNRGQQQQQQPQQMPPQQMPPQQQQQQQQQQQRMPGMPGYHTMQLPPGMEQGGEGHDMKLQAQREALLEYFRQQNAGTKMYPQRGPMPPQQQQQQQRMPGMPGAQALQLPAGMEQVDGHELDQMAEMLRGQDPAMKALQQQRQQQQRAAGLSGYPSSGPEHGDSFEQKTQAEKDALLEVLRTQSGPAKPNNNNNNNQQQQQLLQRGGAQQQQQQRLGGGIGGMLPASAVGPHLDPAIASAIVTGSPAAAGAGASAHMSPAKSSAAAAAAARGKVEVDDEYGLKPLVKVLTAAPLMSATPHVPTAEEPTDVTTGRPISQQEADELNFSFITRGFDITQLGLSVSQQEWLHPTLATLPLDTHNYFILPEFKIPDSYKKPRPRSLSMKSFHQFKEETLFYIFYSMPRDVLHLAAARALYERGWRYHKREQHWFHPVKNEDGAVMETVTEGPEGQKTFTGVYNVFHPNEWKQVLTAENYTVSSSDVEDQSVLVAAMEEAARQQAQRTRAKAVPAGAAVGGNGSASPPSAPPTASA